MSEAVERRIVAMLDKPFVCPHGNPIPGLDDLDVPDLATETPIDLLTLRAAGAASPGQWVVVERISEQLQPDTATMHQLTDAGLRPGDRVRVAAAQGGVEVWSFGERVRLDQHVSDHIFVRVD